MGGRVANKVALVTGAAAGLGRAHRRRLSREGARVVLCNRNTVTLTEVVERLSGEHRSYGIDVTRKEDWRNVVGAVMAEFGRLDFQDRGAGSHPRGGALLRREELPCAGQCNLPRCRQDQHGGEVVGRRVSPVQGSCECRGHFRPR